MKLLRSITWASTVGWALVSLGAQAEVNTPSQYPLHDNGLNKVVQWDHYSFKINGRRLFVFSGELHYWRIPIPEVWDDLLEKIKAAGFTACKCFHTNLDLLSDHVKSHFMAIGHGTVLQTKRWTLIPELTTLNDFFKQQSALDCMLSSAQGPMSTRRPMQVDSHSGLLQGATGPFAMMMLATLQLGNHIFPSSRRLLVGISSPKAATLLFIRSRTNMANNGVTETQRYRTLQLAAICKSSRIQHGIMESTFR